MAKHLKVSTVTIYKAKNAVPKQAMHLEDRVLASIKRKYANRSMRRKRKLKRVA